jgi:archaellum component FlaF (FlaF/FlaG flagellin family)
MVAAGTEITDATIGETTLSLFLQTNFAISPAVLNFGTVNQGSSSTLISTLTNTGQGNESIESIQLIDGAGNYTESNNCGATLAPGASCAITVALTPKQGDALFSASVRITYGGALGSPQSILLTGSDIF